MLEALTSDASQERITRVLFLPDDSRRLEQNSTPIAIACVRIRVVHESLLQALAIRLRDGHQVDVCSSRTINIPGHLDNEGEDSRDDRSDIGGVPELCAAYQLLANLGARVCHGADPRVIHHHMHR